MIVLHNNSKKWYGNVIIIKGKSTRQVLNRLLVNMFELAKAKGATHKISPNQGKGAQTSNDIIAGNVRVLKFYLFIELLYLFKKYIMLIEFFLFSFWCNIVLHLMVVVYNIIYLSIKKQSLKQLPNSCQTEKKHLAKKNTFRNL